MNPMVYDYGFISVKDKEVRELIRVNPDLALFTAKCLGWEPVALALVPIWGFCSKYQECEC